MKFQLYGMGNKQRACLPSRHTHNCPPISPTCITIKCLRRHRQPGKMQYPWGILTTTAFPSRASQGALLATPLRSMIWRSLSSFPCPRGICRKECSTQPRCAFLLTFLHLPLCMPAFPVHLQTWYRYAIHKNSECHRLSQKFAFRQ